jgi:hypothetical protein
LFSLSLDRTTLLRLLDELRLETVKVEKGSALTWYQLVNAKKAHLIGLSSDSLSHVPFYLQSAIHGMMGN